ncbi:hypothetical protein TPHA_0E00450 [Tetrapisispora phaffii CBS 4417]|uniref:Superoxide dismutase [Cu-Zn] n=1 Tax=Tetrapisispora phaffii (strain ATCC 24235 / CBS 4417 / NBRC 1672 / NRRL Y-8282 / UCD 70-5) TaxID=1071381 RepID=G8BTB3_TETPH|nr:hypothetical protein TPHA_0E00450 [Tetrapisispora phaffii CBS 4417]CCE63141.1 hypothetical protein TPHA_0E00450 [Tetrapisispora phaffii CBS 4417]
MVSAVAYLNGTYNVSGIVHLTQYTEDSPTNITWYLEGNTPNALRGFHIHEFGNTSNHCMAAGGHYNPFKMNHGAPNATVRHVGDLGNVQTDSYGIAEGFILDDEIKLFGANSVLGRTLVIHSGTDDLGLGNNPESLINGNSGPRAACGIINIL